MLLSVLLQAANTTDYSSIGIAFAIAITVVGAGLGISKIASSAMESMARQPEVAPDLRMSMIIAAAFIEGVALFAIVVSGFIL